MTGGRRGDSWLKRAFIEYPGLSSVVAGVFVATLYTASPCLTVRGGDTDHCALTLPGQGTVTGGIVVGVAVALGLWLWWR